MSLSSQIILAVTPEAAHAFMAMLAKNPPALALCNGAYVYLSAYEQEGDWLVFWPDIDWRDRISPGVAAITAFVRAMDGNDLSEYGEPSPPDGQDWRDHFRYIHISATTDKVESKGWVFRGIHLQKSIVF